MRFSVRTGVADQDAFALLVEEAAGGTVADEELVDQRAITVVTSHVDKSGYN